MRYFLRLHLFISFLFTWTLQENVFYVPRVYRTIAGHIMKNVSTCDSSDSNFSPLSSESKNIYILTSATPDFAELFKFQIDSVRLYSVLHGYNFRVANPLDVMDFYKLIPKNEFSKETWIKDWKPFTYYCKYAKIIVLINKYLLRERLLQRNFSLSWMRCKMALSSGC